jgi:glycolate oxidase iron-sulfur subunit
VAERHPLPITVAYHDACHLAHGQGIRSQPRALLAAIPDLQLREIAEPEICCGSAGVYNILNPQPARELGDRKAANILATGAQLLVTANPGCLMHVAAALARRGQQIALAHTVQVLDASIRGTRINRTPIRDTHSRGSRPRGGGRATPPKRGGGFQPQTYA